MFRSFQISLRCPLRSFSLFLYITASLSGQVYALDSDLSERLDRVVRQLEQLNEVVRNQQKRIEQLENENSILKSKQQGVAGSTPSTVQNLEMRSSPPSTRGGERRSTAPSTGLSGFNPEIGVVADLTAVLTESEEDFEGNDKLSVREIEFVFGHDIDPYSRFDTTITFSDFESPAIEDAYISHWGLPYELRARIGRMRPKLGKANALHRDQLDTVDEPFVVQEYLGIEGLYRTGIELSSFLPTSGDTFTQELVLGVMEGGIGEEGTLFGETRRRPSFYSRITSFWEVSDDDSLDLGLTYMLGSADSDSSYEVNAFGVDLTFIHRLPAANDRLKFQSELFYQERDQAALMTAGHGGHGEEEEHVEDEEEDHSEQLIEELPFDSNPFGLYVLGDYRFDQFAFGALSVCRPPRRLRSPFLSTGNSSNRCA
jgi:hypothetical protein